ncbi:tyrosine phosphatase RQ [Salpingoeca rosetta]|uniref:protein-tyrosine-phosphatase n=1 Tax=Salpingoeca rosetta (strain ATCC 50818 / BSB-021) TaxID=946362 RepID=F2U5M1_SALR5|nr:tyrosine phosphatase RQ [Salpingoeca rosetta]EGD83237.1 tyrosine phosphatase RQ [Salpingoeca rosetta]|eukprot:XP_004995601.1 tyrosine phosphatase RQ [Salpingoeca rosetta]
MMADQTASTAAASGGERPMRLLSVQDLRTLAQEDSTSQLLQEFERIPTFMASPADIPDGTGPKNRYVNVLPSPHSRVNLGKVGSDHTSTYINANFVTGYNHAENTYIAAQGPKANTIWDFWRMIWEHKCRIIVMMTGLRENGRAKCDKYWPDIGETMTDKTTFTVRTVEDVDCEDYVLTTFSLQHIPSGETVNISHYWFTSWPDHGVPDETWPVLDFVGAVRKHANHSHDAAPIVVHCSAGIGRTGTFMCLDICMQELQSEWRVCDVFGTVYRMRQERGGAVQTGVQYTFIHKALYDYVTPGHPKSMFGSNMPRDVGLIKPSGGSFGFTLRGSCPPFVVKLDKHGIAKANGIKLADHLLAVNQQDTSTMEHTQVVELIRNSGDVVTLTVISKAPIA